MTNGGRRGYVAGLIALLVVAVALGIASVISLTAGWRINSPQYTTGSVTLVVPANPPGSDSQRCQFTVTYSVAGETYSFDEATKGPCPYSTGDLVDVMFSSDEPQSGQMDRPAPWSAWLGLAASLTVGILAVLALRRSALDL